MTLPIVVSVDEVLVYYHTFRLKVTINEMVAVQKSAPAAVEQPGND